MPQGIQIYDEYERIILDFTDSITRYVKTLYSEAKLGTYDIVEAFSLGPKELKSRFWCNPRIGRITDYFGVERGPFPAFNIVIATKDDIRGMVYAPQDWKDKRLVKMNETDVYILLTSQVLINSVAPDKSSISIDVGKY